MDKARKFINKLSEKIQIEIDELLNLIELGRIRIIFKLEDGHKGIVLSVGFKDDNTYKGL